MFTGLIQQVGTLLKIATIDGGARLHVRAPWDTPLTAGESIAVNGACLTVTDIMPDTFACDVLRETLNRTNLGGKRSGDGVNLERALRLGDALGGHLVTGHVDGTGVVRDRRTVGRDLVLRVSCATALMHGIVPKGSIAVDGVSLTVAELSADSFAVHLIPFTRAASTLNALAAGAIVNLETDLIGKHVTRYLQNLAPQSQLTMEQLTSAGF